MKWMAALILVGCMSPVMHFGDGKSAHEAQHDTLEEFMPARLSTEGSWHATADAKIRVYADDEYRAQNIHWQQVFDQQLEYANAVLGPQFGVHLVAEYRVWNHHAPANGLPEDIEELRALDSGGDVLSVVGLTSSLSLASATFDLLGFASVNGRHIMLRGYADLEERKAFARAFPDLASDERDNALEARRRHKLAAVLLHELAHNLGAQHEGGETLMSATYSEHASAFSSETHTIVQHNLDQRLGREGAPIAPVAKAPIPDPVETPTVHKVIQVRVTPDRTTVDNEAMTDDGQFTMKLIAVAGNDKDTAVVFHATKAVSPARVTELVERAKRVGLTKITTE
jgi:hypothetical protein